MATNFTNRKSSQSLNGAAVIVTLDSTDAANLNLLSDGMLATNSTSGKTGTVRRVDYEGNSFQVIPIQMDKNFDSSPSVYGYISVGTVVSVNT